MRERSVGEGGFIHRSMKAFLQWKWNLLITPRLQTKMVDT
jgi:hypothetical protein